MTGPIADPMSRPVVARLLAFEAWLAGMSLPEPSRRGHRHEVELFLAWSRTDGDPVRGRRRRYERQLADHDRVRIAQIRTALDLWAEYGLLIARQVRVPARMPARQSDSGRSAPAGRVSASGAPRSVLSG